MPANRFRQRFFAGAGDGTHRGHHDLIRVPKQSSEGVRVNKFLVDFYRSVALGCGLEAREHTAWAPNNLRQAWLMNFAMESY
ncbi:MAG: hypothetical protein R3A46_12640 [Thermomicrobiales bacterium]